MSGVFFDVGLALLAGYFRDLAEMLVHELFEALTSGEVFLNDGNLISGNVFGDIPPALAVLEIVVRLTVRADSDDGEVTVLHAGDSSYLSDTFGNFGCLHASLYM